MKDQSTALIRGRDSAGSITLIATFSVYVRNNCKRNGENKKSDGHFVRDRRN